MELSLDEVKKSGRFAYLEPAEGYEHCVYAPGEGSSGSHRLTSAASPRVTSASTGPPQVASSRRLRL